MIKGSIKGMDKFFKAAEKAAKSFETNRNFAVKEATLKLHEYAVKIVSANSGGTPSLRYSPKRTVTVSRPGDPPHTDTGRLRQSIKFDIKKDTGRVGSNLKYAAWLEFGTEDMAARPWLSVAVDESAKDVGEIFQKWMEKSVKEIGK